MDAADARRYMTRAVKTAEKIMYQAFERGDDDMALKAATRITQGVQTLLKVIEVDELEARIEALERQHEALDERLNNPHNGYHHAIN
jgi:ubiquinone biosynthesis protein UbiJ